jgi:hypothetical protein
VDAGSVAAPLGDPFVGKALSRVEPPPAGGTVVEGDVVDVAAGTVVDVVEVAGGCVVVVVVDVDGGAVVVGTAVLVVLEAAVPVDVVVLDGIVVGVGVPGGVPEAGPSGTVDDVDVLGTVVVVGVEVPVTGPVSAGDATGAACGVVVAGAGGPAGLGFWIASRTAPARARICSGRTVAIFRRAPLDACSSGTKRPVSCRTARTWGASGSGSLESSTQ